MLGILHPSLRLSACVKTNTDLVARGTAVPRLWKGKEGNFVCCAPLRESMSSSSNVATPGTVLGHRGCVVLTTAVVATDTCGSHIGPGFPIACCRERPRLEICDGYPMRAAGRVPSCLTQSRRKTPSRDTLFSLRLPTAVPPCPAPHCPCAVGVRDSTRRSCSSNRSTPTAIGCSPAPRRPSLGPSD